MRSHVYMFPVLVLAMVLGQIIGVSLEWNIAFYGAQKNHSNQVDNQLLEDSNTNKLPNMNSIRYPTRVFSISDTEATGILDPVTVEQLGYTATGNIGARTDSGLNTASDLSLDLENGWLGSIAELEVWDLKRLYAANGSFEDGLPGQNVNPDGAVDYYPYGWGAISYNASAAQTQVASYDESGRSYVVIENQGVKVGPSGKKYDHIAGTYVLWNQTVNNTPYTQNFVLSFDYLYLRGPLGEDAPGNCTISVFVNNTVIWNQSLPKLDQRGVWYSTGSIPINVAGAASTFDFKIGLFVDEYMDLNADADYNNDGTADGIANTAYITVNIDDVSFTGLNPPSFEEVEFEFTAGNETVPVTGSSGQGNASIVNETYWNADPVPSLVTSNVSCSFEYETRLLSHRFLNSTWTTDPTKQGVHYTSIPDTSPELSFNTYVGTIGTYEEFTLNITHPVDWENATIFDPFLNDVTSQCTLGDSFVTIPESLLDILGWWKVELESYNYAKSIEIQKYDSLATNWAPSTEFRSGNTTRAAISIGTITETPTLTVNPVNVTWFLPNGTSWSSESVYSPIAGEVNSSEWILGPLNTSAGEWYVEVQWTNGTEIAHAHVPFAMYHSTTLTPQYIEIETEVGPLVTNFLSFVDEDNGEYLMDETANIVGNWSGPNIGFAPNLQRNWWEGDFNTSLVGGGVFLVIVNASLPYYDNATCQFTVNCTYSATLDLRDAGTVNIEFHDTYEIVFYYEHANGTGITGASISFIYSGSSNGLLNSSPIQHEPGNYSLNVTGLKSGTYLIEISASKQYYETESDQFTLVVNEVNTELVLFNGTSAITQYLDDYRIVLHYRNSTGYGLEGATVENVSVTPTYGLTIEPTQDEGFGNYSIILRPTIIATFSVLIKANLSNHETQYVAFTLTATELQTTLTLNTTTIQTIGVTGSCTVRITFADSDNNGIDGADVAVYDPSPYLDYGEIQDLTDGNYTLKITPLDFGTFLVKINASKQYCQNGYTSFTLIVEATETNLISLNGTAGSIRYQNNYTLVLRYLNYTGGGLEGASIRVIEITPALGLINYTPIDKGEGNYSLKFKPNATTSFTIQIIANLTAHETKYFVFTLTGLQIQTTLILNSSIETISVSETYTVKITYRDDLNSGIDDADITIVDPPAYLSFSEPTKLGDGNYTITIDPLDYGTYLITITIEKDNYRSRVDSFSLTVNAIETELIVANGTVGISQYQENYTLVIKYLNSTGHGLSGATIQIINIEPAIGLINYTPQDKNDGNYSINLKPNATRTFTILIQVNLTAHKPQLGTFTLTGTAVPTTLDLNISAGISIPYGDKCAILVSFLDDDLIGIEDANINVTGSVGIGYPIITELTEGNYTITLNPTERGAYIITVEATKDNYQTRFASFSLSVEEIETNLIVLNGTSAQVEYGEDYRVVVYYTNILEQGLTDATVEMDSVNPESGLINGSTIPGENGYYSIELTPTVTSVLFTIVIKAELPNHQTKLVTFTLSAVEASTSFTLPNSSDDSIRFGEFYNLSVLYKDSSGIGLLGASISIVSVSPSSGLSINPAKGGEEGYYTILLTPNVAESFILTLKANLTNYKTQIITFTLIVNEIPTTLTLDKSVASVAMDRNYTVQLLFKDDEGNGLEKADILTLTLYESELIISDVLEIGNGYYNVTITPYIDVQLGHTYSISFRAYFENYQNSTVGLSLDVTLVPTNLRILGGIASATISFSDTYEFIVIYKRTDSNESITGASISVNSGSIQELSWRFNEEETGYRVIFNARAVKTWALKISAYKQNHSTAEIEFTLTSNEIDTSIIVDLGSTELLINRLREFAFTYSMSSNDSGIEGATIEASGEKYEWVSIEEVEEGNYSISILPTREGSYSITLTFEKYGFETNNYRIQFSVNKIPIKISIVTAPDFGEPSLTVKLFEGELNDNILVTNVTLSYVIFNSNGDERKQGEMEETGGLGIYETTYNVVREDIGGLIIIFEISEYGYEIDDDYQQISIQILDPSGGGFLSVLYWNIVPISEISLFLIAIVVVQRVYSKRRRRQALEALAVKRRFDDLKNLIGIIVLHKTSGLPIYSKMLTTGFDSSMISAFITAIRSFRSEIETESAEPEFDLIPISDIVRVVTTRSLICAFITVTRPTPTQSEKMIEFAKGVGFQFDDLFDMIPAEVIDEDTVLQFEYHFNNLMDGKLLKKFRMADYGKFPRRLKCVERRFEHLEVADGFDLDDLAAGVASCGLEEARAYKLIMDYIEKGMIVPLNPEEEKILDLGWEMEEEKRDSHTSGEASSGDTEDSL